MILLQPPTFFFFKNGGVCAAAHANMRIRGVATKSDMRLHLYCSRR